MMLEALADMNHAARSQMLALMTPQQYKPNSDKVASLGEEEHLCGGQIGRREQHIGNTNDEDE
jgi:hypothetical protein